MFEPPVDTTAEHPVTPGRVSSWLLAALGLAMIASAAGVLAGFRSAARWRKHTEDVRIVLLQLQDSVVDAETGQRGYLASGDRRFLERYEAGANTWRPTLERARALVADDADLPERVDAIGRGIERKVAEMRTTMEARDGGTSGTALATLMLSGKTIMDTIRAGIADVISTEARIDEARAGEAETQERIASGAFLLAALALAVAAARAWSANRAQAQIEAQRRENARQVLALNEQLSRHARDLEEANRELESFSYSVSHDLRAPIRHIAGFTELLQKQTAGALDAKSAHYMKTIADSAQRAGDLVDKLLAFSRMSRSELKKTRVDMKHCVQSAWRDLAMDRTGRDVTLEVGDLPAVQADPTMIRLVLENLLSNALKYTRPRAQAVVKVDARVEGSEVVFSVKDNGVGFDMRYVDKLFGVFQRLHGPAAFEGFGIGLANVKRIVQRHGGRVWAEGVVDEGATFSFALPR